MRREHLTMAKYALLSFFIGIRSGRTGVVDDSVLNTATALLTMYVVGRTALEGRATTVLNSIPMYGVAFVAGNYLGMCFPMGQPADGSSDDIAAPPKTYYSQ